jgi:selenocysteine lyase/cysteine desulfurase
MAAPSSIVPVPELREGAAGDFAAEAALQRVRTAAATARERLAEIDGVRVIGPEVSAGNRAVRLAIDLRDTGRDAWDVACAMAGRGITLDAASNRVIVVRLSEPDLAEGIPYRLAPALLLALWATPAQA